MAKSSFLLSLSGWSCGRNALSFPFRNCSSHCKNKSITNFGWYALQYFPLPTTFVRQYPRSPTHTVQTCIDPKVSLHTEDIDALASPAVTKESSGKRDKNRRGASSPVLNACTDTFRTEKGARGLRTEEAYIHTLIAQTDVLPSRGLVNSLSSTLLLSEGSRRKIIRTEESKIFLNISLYFNILSPQVFEKKSVLVWLCVCLALWQGYVWPRRLRFVEFSSLLSAESVPPFVLAKKIRTLFSAENRR